MLIFDGVFMSKKAYAILPYKELSSLIEQSSSELDLELNIREGNVEAALPAALEAEKNGADIIISRGGTAEIIRKHIKVPVVDIPVSDVDILKILYPLREQNKTILVVGFKNAVYKCHSVAQILGIRTIDLTVPYETKTYNFDYIKQQAEKLIKEYNVDTIIGDQTAIVNLQSFCESLYLIKSSRDDVIMAIDKTKNALSSYSHFIKSKISPVSSVLDFIDDAIISTNEEGIITIFNKSAENYISYNQKSAIGKKLDEIESNNQYFSKLKDSLSNVLKTNQPEYKQINLKSSSYTINTTPIIIGEKTRGVVSSLKSVKFPTGEENRSYKNFINGFSSKYTFSDIITRDPEILQIIERAKYFSKTNAAILIEGESGVGKEIFAQSIYSLSPRHEKPFIAVNCAAFPPQLLESELFGYEGGTFTGAQKGGKKGLFELADGGTLFLDEIGEMDLSMQVKFLRALEEKQIKRIGGNKIIDVDVQIITATNRDLKQMVSEGNFRTDLYYRINLLKLDIPPLKNRIDDIEYLTVNFINQFNRKHSLLIESINEEAITLLKNYSWPGNIRELKNILERTVLTIRQGIIRVEDIKKTAPEITGNSVLEKGNACSEILSGTLAEIKCKAALQALKDSRYNKSLAARKLGIDRSTLDRLLEQS